MRTAKARQRPRNFAPMPDNASCEGNRAPTKMRRLYFGGRRRGARPPPGGRAAPRLRSGRPAPSARETSAVRCRRQTSSNATSLRRPPPKSLGARGQRVGWGSRPRMACVGGAVWGRRSATASRPAERRERTPSSARHSTDHEANKQLQNPSGSQGAMSQATGPSRPVRSKRSWMRWRK